MFAQSGAEGRDEGVKWRGSAGGVGRGARGVNPKINTTERVRWRRGGGGFPVSHRACFACRCVGVRDHGRGIASSTAPEAGKMSATMFRQAGSLGPPRIAPRRRPQQVLSYLSVGRGHRLVATLAHSPFPAALRNTWRRVKIIFAKPSLRTAALSVCLWSAGWSAPFLFCNFHANSSHYATDLSYRQSVFNCSCLCGALMGHKRLSRWGGERWGRMEKDDDAVTRRPRHVPPSPRSCPFA